MATHMDRGNIRRNAALGLAAVALVTGCASTPTAARSPAAEIGGCSELDAEIGIIEEAKRGALEKQQGAWKVVIPLAVAARYAGAKSAAADADKRLKELRDEFARQRCGEGRES